MMIARKCVWRFVRQPMWLLPARLRQFGTILNADALPRPPTRKRRGFATDQNSSITLVDFHHKSEATLDELAEYFESLPETDINCDENYDVHLSDGVLTISLGEDLGTYVINKQTPNRQLWFSSPLSGPKRYDFLNGNWIYKRDGMSLHSRLTTELTQLYGKPVDLMHLLAKEVEHN